VNFVLVALTEFFLSLSFSRCCPMDRQIAPSTAGVALTGDNKSLRIIPAQIKTPVLCLCVRVCLIAAANLQKCSTSAHHLRQRRLHLII
jgi:hypothetical protein